jgi:hypothetical protein
MPYPPGVSAGSPRAPWNAPEPDECELCGGVYTEGGHEAVEVEDIWFCIECGTEFQAHEPEECPECAFPEFGNPPCPNGGVGHAERQENKRMAEGDRKYDAMKEREMFD